MSSDNDFGLKFRAVSFALHFQPPAHKYIGCESQYANIASVDELHYVNHNGLDKRQNLGQKLPRHIPG